MIITGDCLEEMRKMESNSISCVVTDPPYGLKFMGQEWDAGLPHSDIWKEAIRICKPGAFLLCFGGTRTYHRLTCAIEDAGWEIRDCISWLYGSGFPKSLNISKAIDKSRNDYIRHICAFIRKGMLDKQISYEMIADQFGFDSRMARHWAAPETDSQPRMPTLEQYKKLKEMLSLDDSMDSEVIRLNERKGQIGEAAQKRGFVEASGGRHIGGRIFPQASGTMLSNNSVLDLAKQFDGFGTALKPAYEPIIVAMKPCEGTFSQNAEKWGQAGINIDGCRIGFHECSQKEWTQKGSARPSINCYGKHNPSNSKLPIGRWPTNVIFDEEAAEQLDEMTEIGASRFFYCAKASSDERDEGLNGHSSNVDGQSLSENKIKNHHPTVKPLKLMEYLIKLVMPPSDGVLLDPFAGSGSTIVAAKKLGVKAIGIEKCAEYAEIARARVEYACE